MVSGLLLVVVSGVQARCYRDSMQLNVLGCAPGFTCRYDVYYHDPQLAGKVCPDPANDNCWCYPDEQPVPPVEPPSGPSQPPGLEPEPYIPTTESPPQSCSADKPYEIVPSCVYCPDPDSGKVVLFCYGNKFRLCETDQKIPGPTGNLTQWLSPGDFPAGTVLYNSVTFAVPPGGVFVCDNNVFGCNNPGCEGISLFKAPIGYLDQMNVTAEKEIDPFQSKQPWFWAECYKPGSGWDIDCVEALNKMGFSSDNPLHYPLWLQEWRDYMVNTVLPRRTPYHLQKEVVEYAQKESNFPVQGWIEFVTSGENNEGKRTKITNPRAWLFGAKFVGQLSYATDWVWRSFTGLYDQLKKPVLVRDGREPHSGEVAPNNDVVDFGALSGPPPGLYAADMLEGSCQANEKITNPWALCGTKDACSKHCLKVNPETGELYLHYEKEERWAMRQVNPDIPGHDMIETLNPGWEALANSWSNVANPINGFVPAIARKYDLEVNMGDDCPDLFGSEEDLQAYSLAMSRDLRPSLCSWRYAKTPFTYNYGPFVPGVVENQMEAHACAEVIDPEDPDASRKEKECYAHWPFVGGLQKVKEFIHQFTNTFRHDGLAGEPGGSIAEIKSQTLGQYLNEAGAAFKVPAGVLAGVMNFEGFHPNGPHLFDYPEEWVIEDSQPGAKDRYCATSPAGAKGPMQFMPGQWEIYKNAVVETGARPAGYKPEICNIKDAIYAAAKKLRDDLNSYNDSCACSSGVCAQAPAPTGVNWSKADVYHTSCHYYGNCSDNYCATVWLYYQNSGG